MLTQEQQAYFLGWNSRVGIGAFLLCFLSALVLSPPFRTFAFPPRPPALSPAAPTLSPSELAESEATAFADEVSQLAASPTSEPPLSVEDLLDPVPVEEETKKEDKARVTKLAKHGLPIQRFAGDVADGWERWANALEPTSPFPTHEARIKVALYLLPVALALAVVPTAMIVSALTAVAGLAFFGDPMLRLGIRLLDQHAGSWREAVEIQQYVLFSPLCETRAQFSKSQLHPRSRSLQCSAHHHPFPHRRSIRHPPPPSSSPSHPRLLSRSRPSSSHTERIRCDVGAESSEG